MGRQKENKFQKSAGDKTKITFFIKLIIRSAELYAVLGFATIMNKYNRFMLFPLFSPDVLIFLLVFVKKKINLCQYSRASKYLACVQYYGVSFGYFSNFVDKKICLGF